MHYSIRLFFTRPSLRLVVMVVAVCWMGVACRDAEEQATRTSSESATPEAGIRALVQEEVARALAPAALEPAIREEVGRTVSPDALRSLVREEVERALAAREAQAEPVCDVATATVRALPSVVRVESYRPGSRVLTATGTGFAALAGGIVVTAAHVLGDGSDVEVVTLAGQRLTTQILRVDASTDIAVLRASDSGLPPVKWAESNAIYPGEPVRILGFPGDSETVRVTGGVFSSRVALGANRREEILTDADADPGNSGGPVLTRCGEALGVVVERRPFITTVTTVAVGAGSVLPFVVAAAATPP